MTTTYKPLGFTVLVQLDPEEATTKGGIIIARTDEFKRKEAGKETGVIIDIGNMAFTDKHYECKIGDRVCFKRYAGVFISEDDTTKIRLINDEDILALIEEKE